MKIFSEIEGPVSSHGMSQLSACLCDSHFRIVHYIEMRDLVTAQNYQKLWGQGQ